MSICLNAIALDSNPLPHRQEARNEPNKSFRHSWIHKPSQGESVEALTPPHHAHIYYLNAECGQEPYAMWVYAHFLRRYLYLGLICIAIFKGLRQPLLPPPTNCSRRFLIPPSEDIWGGVHQRTNARRHVFIGINIDCWRRCFTLSSECVQRLFSAVSLVVI